MIRYNANEKTGELGQTIGNARVARGLTQFEAGRAIGLTRRSFARIEGGTRTLASRHVRRLANLLNLDHTTLAGLALQRTSAYRKLNKSAV